MNRYSIMILLLITLTSCNSSTNKANRDEDSELAAVKSTVTAEPTKQTTTETVADTATETTTSEDFRDSQFSDTVNGSINKIIKLPEVQTLLANDKYKLNIEKLKDSEDFVSLTILENLYTLEDFQFKIYEDGRILRWYSEASSFLEIFEASNNANEDQINNRFFFSSHVSQVKYKGKFQFDEDSEQNVNLFIQEKASNLKDGQLYELIIDGVDDVPNDRLTLGYFYVQKDKIIKLEPTEENLQLIKSGQGLLSTDTAVVCQDTESLDPLGQDEPGWHHSLDVDGDRRIYRAYNTEISTGYYETFIWEKNKGLIQYRSGYGAERDSIELQLAEAIG